MSDAFLAVDAARKRFGSYTALHDVSFTLARGEVATLLGPSGCGKTTMLRAIAGLERLDGGRVTLDGRVLSDGAGRHAVPERRGIGMVFQSYALWPHKTVAQNVGLGLRLKRVPRAAVAERVASALAMVGLPGIGDRYPASLSGGQQQRVSLARALAFEPACLLFDEPLSNLDLVLRERMRFEIREILVRAGITAVYVTHDQSEAMAVSDRLLIMHGGRIVQDGVPAAVYRRPLTRFVAEFLGRANLLPLDRSMSDTTGGRFVGPDGVVLQGAPAQAGTLIAFRPESVRPATAGEAENCLDTVVESCAFLGGSTQCRLRVGGSAIVAALPGHHALAAGAALRVRVDPDGVTLVAESAGVDG